MPAYTDTLYKYQPEVKHRAFTLNDLLKWGELVASGFRNRVPVDLVEVYYRNHQPVLFYSSLQASDSRDNRLMRQLVAKVMETGVAFRFPYFERDVFDDVRYTDVLTLGRSVLILPVKLHEVTVGAVALASRVPDVFRDDVLPLLSAQAENAAVVYRTLFDHDNAFTRFVDAGFYFNQLPDPFCVVNADCKVEYGNDAFKKFYEINTGSAGNGSQDLGTLMGDGKAAFEEQMRQTLLQNEFTFQHTFLIAGSEKRYRVRMLRVNETHVGIWFYNVYEETESTETIAVGTDRDAVLTALPYAAWEVSKTSTLAYVNQRFLDATGYSADEVRNRSFFELLHPGQFTRYFELLRNAFSDHRDESEPQTFTAKLKTKNNDWLSISGTIGNANGSVWFFGNEAPSHQPVFAITVQGVADALPVGIVALDELFNCRYLSQAAVSITGYDTVEAQTTAFPVLVFNENASQQLMDRLALLQAGETFDGIYELREKSGTTRCVSLTATSVKDESDKTFYLLVLHDVTVLNVEAERWKELAHTAQDNQHAEEQYLARMSHEIRTAMNGIIGLTNVLMQAGLPGEQQQILNLIKQSTDNLLVIVNDILDLSKIKSGKLQVEKIPVSLRVLFENIYAITLPKVGQKEIQFTYRVDPGVPEYVETDPVRLNQILLNLLSNAVKFTDKGKVEYGVAATTNGRNAPVLQFEVRDSGIGIGAGELDSVFEAYRQAETSTTRKYGGTGLGLPIVKQLVTAMGGRIDVTSHPGRGSVFTFTLPLVESKAAPATTEDAVAVQDVPPGLRVLVVDDNYINRLLVIHLLQSRGFDVVEAASGYEALDLLREEDIDAVLMDISMPDLDGFETTRLIRRSEESYIRDVPVIAMTAHGFQEQVNNAREAGMNDYVVKPFKPDGLVGVILKQLGAVTTPAAKPTTRLYDLAFIEDYYNKDEKFIRHILGLYVKETPHTVHEIEQALEQKNWPQVKALVHKIKTNVLMLGIQGQEEFFKASSTLKPDQPDATALTALFQPFRDTVLNALEQIRADKLT